jgi:hypothetical protein
MTISHTNGEAEEEMFRVLTPCLPNLTQLDFHLLGFVKDSVYSTKPETLQELRHIKQQCADIWVNICLEVNGSHFEHTQQFVCHKLLLLHTPNINLF